ncbi:toxin-activating lysine-acyltransferase [Hirschia maritima]|uniref:toxin-activating lysine-acyltransferase n=1 Tax=Hirschia maritima TaxID=1121961 RepID=UPI0003769A33|nr:toxin-activating lysine-acyltransferase [Hirschia maritima]
MSGNDMGAQMNAEPAPKKTVSQVLGEVTWLLTQSPIHKQLFIGDLEWFVMPAVLLEQFRIFNGPNHPAGVALWANVSEETEKRLMDGGYKLRPDEWKGGDRAWLIELIAPFGGQDEMMKDFSEHIFKGKPFKFHKTGPDGVRMVETYSLASKDESGETAH